ncbi:flavanone 3-dioxygenase 2-like [Zingiber officinale]|uniref:flavanone 3-dioxygenase 2-like n=1 Tax=Zingiber officinale TaxID=94328 RepID=UPI001C4D3B91|nr:flavanone 3-dioxygenase 2-like [Zingiber officinale]
MADQLLSTISRKLRSLPASYVRPESQRPRLHEVISDAAIPTVDLGSPDQHQIVAQIADACTHYGFFQVVNHGVGNKSMRLMMEVAQEFFQLPAEEKAKLYSDDPAKKIRLSTSFNIRKETVRNWRDYLRLHCYPLEDFTPEWPSNPSSFKEVVSDYCKEVRGLGFRLLGLISLSLGLEEEYMVKVLGEQEQHMAINYYPKCPAPDLTYGLQAHTDPNALTILLQDHTVDGLQIRKDDKWIAVGSHPHSFIINIGDQLQALSNGRYKSVWHRAIVNANKDRMSVASFLCPSNRVLISPPEKLLSEAGRAMYKNYTYEEYYDRFWSRNLDDEHCLELFKNASSLESENQASSSSGGNQS